MDTMTRSTMQDDIRRVIYGDGASRGLLERFASLETELAHLRAAVMQLTQEVTREREILRAYVSRMAWAAIAMTMTMVSQLAFLALMWHRSP